MNLTTESSTSTIALPESWVERLFERMLLDYGKKFSEQWGGADTDALIAHWSRELAGYTGAELKRGLDTLSTRDWPPTLPEFKKMCRAPVDSLVAYYEAVAGARARHAGEFGKWSHPAIYWAAMPLSTDLLQQTFSQVKPRWELALAEELAKGAWPDVPRPMLALTAPPQQTKEAAEQALRNLMATAIKKKPTDQIDHLAWAKKILERERRGDKSLLVVQVRFAREAMQLPA